MGDEIEREIEGRNPENHAKGKAADDPEVAQPWGTGFHIDAVAIVAERKCRCESKGLAGPVQLGLGKGHGFSGLGDDHVDKFLAPLAEKLADPLERRSAGIA